MMSDSIIKVLVLQRESLVAPGVPSLSVAARITDVLEYLSSRREVEFAIISEKDAVAMKGIVWGDVLILSKQCSEHSVELAQNAHMRGIKIIYDLDDWIFSFPKYSGGHCKGNNINLINKLLELSDIVSVSNKTLLDKIKPIVPRPTLLPNGMWVEKYADKEMQPDFFEAYPPRIVFTNADFLKLRNAKEMLLTALQVFFLNNTHYILDFYGDPFPEIFYLPFLHFTNRMPYSDYMQALASGRYQFAIIPLGGTEDTEESDFNQCKNPFKYLNYGACRVPGIYSRSHIYEETVEHGKTGIIVENNFQSWLNALETMSSNAGLRQSIRESAFDDVMENYHIKKSAEVMMKMLTSEKI